MTAIHFSGALCRLQHIARLPLLLLFGAFVFGAGAQSAPQPKTPSLQDRVRAFDTAFFNAFNTCDLPTLERMVSSDLEFFHDVAGTSRSRATFVASVKNNVCGKFTRELVKPSFESWTLGQEGAIYSGTHQFCHAGKTGCQGEGRFLHILEDRNGQLVLLRVASYDHREVKPSK